MENLKRHYARIGALLNVSVRPAIRRFWSTRDIDFLIDVIENRRGEAFHLTTDEEALPNLELHRCAAEAAGFALASQAP